MANAKQETLRILLFVRRVMPNATEAELIEASDRVRKYADFVIRMQERIERERREEARKQGSVAD